MITVSLSLDDLFNLVWQRTVYLSENIDQNPTRPDITPVNGNNRDIFNTFCKEAANHIWMKLAKYATEDSSVEDTFILNFNTAESGSEETYPGQLVYILDEPDNWVTSKHTAMLTNAIQNTVVSWVIYRWMLMKGLGKDDGTQIEHASYIENLALIDRAMTYGKRFTLPHRTF